jgi:hypothetical protein
LLKLPITYDNPFTNQPVTEEHFFHISKADLVEMEIEDHGQTYLKDDTELTGMQAKLQRIIDAEDGKAILSELKDIIRRAYGQKDGDRFRKSKEISDDFLASEAFSQLLFDLCTDGDKAAQFMNGIIPPNLEQIAGDVQKQAEQARLNSDYVGATSATPERSAPATTEQPSLADRIAAATPENPITLTEVEVREMDSDELKSGLATGRIKLS